ncbi:polyphenol oxidase family protein [Ilumatobacter sp.]|uniref:polyphenol oxidase family protein n=1 Tax=Ilumatobacter sp. TaxID=1967498 RepID=UPI0030AD67E2
MAVDLLDRVEGMFRLRAVATERIDGDMHPARVQSDVLHARQHAVTGTRWTMADQVHGRDIHVASDSAVAVDAWPLGGVADVIVSEPMGRPIAIWAADCAPIVLFGTTGLVVAAHAGWRGLAAGVVDAAVGAVIDAGDSVATAVIGPMVHPCCYEFSIDDIGLVASGVRCAPAAITALSTDGHLALDAPAAVRAALRGQGIAAAVLGGCTGCNDRWFSHRARIEPGRHAVVAWVESHDRVTP